MRFLSICAVLTSFCALLIENEYEKRLLYKYILHKIQRHNGVFLKAFNCIFGIFSVLDAVNHKKTGGEIWGFTLVLYIHKKY